MKDKEVIIQLDWEDIIMNVGKPVWDKKMKTWRVLDGYKRIEDKFYVHFTDMFGMFGEQWCLFKDTKLYLKEE